MSAEQLITDHLDLWTSAVTYKSGRGAGKNRELTGIKKLRELIRELAVRGKLVEQNPNDEPASVLLDKIAEEKVRLVKDGKIKKPKKLPEIGEEEQPFAVPKEWQWARMEAISEYIQRGKGPKYSESGNVRVISQKCVQWSGFDFSVARFIDDSSLSSYQDERYIKNGDIVWNSTGTGTVGRANAVENLRLSIVADSHITIIRPLLAEPTYILNYVSSPSIQQRIEPNHENSLVSGTTKQVELNSSSVKLLAVPLPPLYEQHRIVAKVDELMALCDRLEQQAGDQLDAHEILVDTLLEALIRAENADEVAAQWARLAEHFDTLFTTDASIDKLKQAILQLAVVGRLVAQDAEDRAGKESLQVIDSRQTETSNAILKKRKKFGPPSDSEIPFPLPKGWVWKRFVDIALEYSVGLDKGKSQQAQNKKHRYFKMNNILKNGGFQLDDIVSVDATSDEISRYSLSSGDFLFNTRNSRDLVGKTCVYIHDGGDLVLYNNNILRAKFDSTERSRFIDIWMRSFEGKRKLENLKSGTTNVWAIYQGKLESLPCPLPPLEEQRRIVAKVDELMVLCDQLKARLGDAGETRTHLAEAVVTQAVE